LTDLSASIQYPKGELLLVLVDQVVDTPSLTENAAPTALPYVFFDSQRQQFSSYIALEQRTVSPNELSIPVCAQSAAASVVSDSADKSPTLQVSELIYFDADTQQCVAYTALTELLMHPDNGETPPRTQSAEVYSVEMDLDDIDKSIGMYLSQPNSSARPRSVETMRCNKSYRAHKARRRLQLTVITQLEDLSEKSSNDDEIPPLNTACSDRSIEFVGQRAFVKPLTERRSDFLDEDDDFEPPQPACPSNSSEVGTSPPVTDYTDTLFVNPIWSIDPVYELTFPSDQPVPADFFPNPDVLQDLEMEVNGALSFMFQRISSGRYDELPEIGSNLYAALSEIAAQYPELRLWEQLGQALEVVLERLVASQ
jgi:hypothetical protein